MDLNKVSRYIPWVVFAGLIVASLQLRTFQIDTRPPHSDESVNFLFVETVNRTGYYPYSHENYHGPLFFYIITGLVNLLGDSLLGLRAGSIICGTLTVAALLFFVSLEGWIFTLIAALLVVISPSMVFFSRYAIHEPLLVLSTLTFAAALYRWTATHRTREIYLAALSIAVMVTVKETFAIIFFTVGLATLAISFRLEDFREFRKQSRVIQFLYFAAATLIGSGFAIRTFPSAESVVASGVPALAIAAASTVGITTCCLAVFILLFGAYRRHFPILRSQTKHLAWAYLIIAVFVLGTFSSVFRWLDGIGEMTLAIPQWIGRSSSDVGHVKVFGYYLTSVIWVTERSLVLAVGGVVLFVCLSGVLSFVREEPFRPAFGRHSRALIFFGTWLAATFVVYSFIPYKTVWLVVNITLPALLFLAAALSSMIASEIQVVRFAGVILLVVATTDQFEKMLHYNFNQLPIPGTNVALADTVPYGPMNPFSYVHTSPGTLDLVDEVFEYWKKKPDARVLVGVDGYFPLPYYFRKQGAHTAYTKITDIDKATENYDVMILDFYKQNWDNPNWIKVYHRLSDYAESYTYFRKLPEEGMSAVPSPTATP